jgi:hypothetical protein
MAQITHAHARSADSGFKRTYPPRSSHMRYLDREEGHGLYRFSAPYRRPVHHRSGHGSRITMTVSPDRSAA